MKQLTPVRFLLLNYQEPVLRVCKRSPRRLTGHQNWGRPSSCKGQIAFVLKSETDQPVHSGRQASQRSSVGGIFYPYTTEPKLEKHDPTDYDYGKKKTVVDRHNNQQGVEIYYCPLKLHNPSFFPAAPYWIQLSMCRPLAKCREEADGLVTRACIAVSDS
ncbi:hypothetical protein T07_6299 [Trichinella nelsoni]|uniref:Uncharacterized protein n=1 Tax=Trichinella nelsoni TaxID=6336 RepID=A0A0V0RRX3_9BILA|nr:hypothetical protein T07_6299 [Trichinella nelsoni]